MDHQFMVRLVWVLNLLASAHAGAGVHADWSYHGPNGPSYWAELFPQFCAGGSQSPIHIDPSSAIPSNFQRVIMNGYAKIPSDAKMEFSNVGHTVQVALTGQYDITGGPLGPWTYQASQFHFHWGNVNSQGSEHIVAGQQYPAEMHIVHWDTRYGSIDNALQHKNGLAVLGVLIEVGNHNPTFENLVKVMANVQFKGDTFDFPEVFAISGLLPDDLDEYFHYDGSLTTPHCNEVIQWVVYQKPIEVSSQQLEALYSVYENAKGDGKDVPLVENFRPTQPLNGRTLYKASAKH